MKKFLNDPKFAVYEMMSGVVGAYPTLKQLGKYTTIVRKELTKNTVGLVSGGGSGHEPAHWGYVGAGMLDAACGGDIFTSPPSGQILEAIQAVDQGQGVLLIIKNYTGDVLNFSLAADLAQSQGIKVGSVVVNDDISIGDPEKRRGVAGTVFIHKVAGAMAESGAPLSEVRRVAEKAIHNLASIGVAIAPCVVPTAGRPTFTLEDDEMELGIGIHGERGIMRTAILSASATCKTLFERLKEQFGSMDGEHVALLLNGMGGTPTMELYLLNGIMHRLVYEAGATICFNLVGEYMTALEMAGFSITIMRLDEELKELLIAPTNAPRFPSFLC